MAAGWYPLGVRETIPDRHPSRAIALVLLVFAFVLPLNAAENTGPSGRPGTASGDEILREAAFEFARGKLLAEEGAFDHALEAYGRALELDGSDPYSRIEVAKLHSHLAQISRRFRVRKIKIHCISVGKESELLRWLAEDSGGQYRTTG